MDKKRFPAHVFTVTIYRELAKDISYEIQANGDEAARSLALALAARRDVFSELAPIDFCTIEWLVTPDGVAE